MHSTLSFLIVCAFAPSVNAITFAPSANTVKRRSAGVVELAASSWPFPAPAGQKQTMEKQVKRRSAKGSPKLHFISMGHSGSCFISELFGKDLPFMFEPFNEAGWGEWKSEFPRFDAPSGDGWKNLNADDRAVLDRRLKCLYECEGCEAEVRATSRGDRHPNPAHDIEEFCSGKHPMVVIKTVNMNNVSSLARLPRDDLVDSKFVLLLRDPRGTGRKNACARQLSLALSVKELVTAVGKQNVRTVFYEHMARNTTSTIKDLADWAGLAMTPALESATQLPGDKATEWALDDKNWLNGHEPWCTEFFELTQYPRNDEINLATKDEDARRDGVNYKRLLDPVAQPLTSDQQQLLASFWKNSGYEFVSKPSVDLVAPPLEIKVR